MRFFLIVLIVVLPNQILSQQCPSQCVPGKSFNNLPIQNASAIFPKLFNISYIKEKTKNYDYFKIYLKEIEHKGIGVFARQKIPANRKIMFYKLKICRYHSKF